MRVYHIVNTISDASSQLDLCTALHENTDATPIVVPLYEQADLSATEYPFDIRHLDYTKPLHQRIYQSTDMVDGGSICHVHHNRSGTYMKMVGSVASFPVVVTEHNNHSYYHRLSRIANGLSNRFADAIVCVSDSVRDSFYSWEEKLLNERDLHVIYNGAPMFRIQRSSRPSFSINNKFDVKPESVIIGSAGMHTKQKGYDVLIPAIKKVNKQADQSVELVLPGKGNQTAMLKQLASNINIDSHVHFTGFLPTREHIYRLMEQFDIFAMPSRWEGHSVAALEAMAHEVPCVLSDIPSFRSVFGDVARFHQVDDVTALSSALHNLIDRPQLRSDIGKAGRRLVEERYTLSRTVEQYYNIYQDLREKY